MKRCTVPKFIAHPMHSRKLNWNQFFPEWFSYDLLKKFSYIIYIYVYMFTGTGEHPKSGKKSTCHPVLLVKFQFIRILIESNDYELNLSASYLLP